jgi:hypothetical protein
MMDGIAIGGDFFSFVLNSSNFGSHKKPLKKFFSVVGGA